VGFETYFHKNRFGDHWVCEYWREDAQRWTLVDAELDALHREAFDVMFDPQDLPEDAFIVSGEMWRRCVDGRVDPGLCGMLNTWGMAYVRGNLVRDVICLSKVENFPWDGAPLTLKPDDDVTAADLALLEYLADITSPEVRIPEVVAAYETHAELHAQRLPLEEAPA